MFVIDIIEHTVMKNKKHYGDLLFEISLFILTATTYLK